jgi:hypothetical protein
MVVIACAHYLYTIFFFFFFLRGRTCRHAKCLRDLVCESSTGAAQPQTQTARSLRDLLWELTKSPNSKTFGFEQTRLRKRAQSGQKFPGAVACSVASAVKASSS